ncbi:MAG TPA: OB-fold domain-containing protein [Acidimicrobiales bacterium]
MTEEHMVTSVLEFPYKRSLGPVIGTFLSGLRDGRLLGIRAPGGRVIVPPLEYDPDTGEGLDTDLVEVGPGATVTSWSWVASPSSRHPVDHPFAFALIQPDGATNSLVHAVDAGDIGAMKTGMRVTPRWREERKGNITDIEAFVPEGSR